MDDQPPLDNKNLNAMELGRLGGLKGGKARAKFPFISIQEKWSLQEGEEIALRMHLRRFTRG